MTLKTGPSESEKFDQVVRKVLSVSHDELQKREKNWQRRRARKKRAKTSPASRAANGKD
jgi:U3 small nucleolar ribonucleoprotein component